MPSSFAADFAACSADFDGEFGEPISITPTVVDDTSEYLTEDADPSNPTALGVTGIFSDDPVLATVLGSGANTHENNDVATRRTRVDVDSSVWPDGNYPQEGWIVTATSQPGQPRYRIVLPEYDGVSRMSFRLAYLGPSVTP